MQNEKFKKGFCYDDYLSLRYDYYLGRDSERQKYIDCFDINHVLDVLSQEKEKLNMQLKNLDIKLLLADIECSKWRYKAQGLFGNFLNMDKYNEKIDIYNAIFDKIQFIKKAKNDISLIILSLIKN